jgi:hypothetical protein
MAKQIVVLSQDSNGTEVSYTVALWFPITSGARVQTSGSVWTGASAAENSAIQAGTVKEETVGRSFPVGTTAAAIKSVLQQMWTERNAQINGIGPNVFYGIFFDSVTGWSA